MSRAAFLAFGSKIWMLSKPEAIAAVFSKSGLLKRDRGFSCLFGRPIPVELVLDSVVSLVNFDGLVESSPISASSYSSQSS